MTVLEYRDDLFVARDRWEITASCYIDIKKAFDCVNHSYLLQMIQTLPLPQSILDWLESYLADRKQCTLVNGETSDYQSLNFSVPQGSILGPLLFIFYINSLPEVVLRAKIKIYADDIVLYVSSKDALTARTILQTELNRVVKHCDALGLTINID